MSAYVRACELEPPWLALTLIAKVKVSPMRSRVYDARMDNIIVVGAPPHLLRIPYSSPTHAHPPMLPLPIPETAG